MMIGLFAVCMAAIFGGVSSGTLGLSSDILGFAEEAKRKVSDNEFIDLVKNALDDPSIEIIKKETGFDELVEVIENGKKLLIRPDVCNEYGYENLMKFVVLIVSFLN
jgi:hypothetical protein